MHIVVTGASSGIGEAIARELGSSALDSVTLVARRKERLEQVAATMAASTRLEVRDLSVLDTGWVGEVEEEVGPVDVLVNNAGVQVVGRTQEVDPEEGERSLRVNLFSPLRLIHAVLPSMLARRSGTIVNISSMAALAPTPGMTYYNASKGGLAAASEALRGELRGTGINVVTVYPGIIGETDMSRTTEAKYEANRALSLQPRGTPAELAAKVARAIGRGRARVIYPRMNAAARWLPGPTRWIIDRFSPQLR